MELVRFKARCHKCHKKLRITLSQARANQSVVCSLGHPVQARAAIEQELIAGVNRGSRYYFECLVEIFDREVRGTIFGTLQLWLRPDLAEAETKDALQNLYLDLWQKGIHKINESLTAYVRGMALHKAIDRMRKRRDGRLVPWETIVESKAFDSTEERLIQGLPVNDLFDLLAQALLTLPKEQEQVFRLRLIDGYSINEVAVRLSIEPGTVKSRLNRATKHIREFMSAAVSARSVP